MTRTKQLEAWLAEEDAVRRRMEQGGAGPGVARLDQVEANGGLALMQAILSGELPYAAIAETLDFLLISVAPGRAVFQAAPLARHLNPLGSVHGGWVAAVLDSALGCSVHTMMPPGRSYTTAELNVHFVKAVRPGVERVRAEGNVIHCGRQLATAEARLVGPDGTLFAHATTTCLVLELRKS